MTDLAELETRPPRRLIEFRSVTDFDVQATDRIITLIAVPYDVDAAVLVRGRAVTESIARGAFDGCESRTSRVKVNRDHDYDKTIGRAVALHPQRDEGLVAELRIAKTSLGDDTLALAEVGALEASVGFAVLPGGEQWLDGRGRRRVTKGWLDHIAMVPEGAYEGRVLDVRALAADVASVATPNLDTVRAWMLTRIGDC
jgi:HK97 family phage prohead protease